MAAVTITTLSHGSNIMFIVKAALKGACLYESYGKSEEIITFTKEMNFYNSISFTQDIYEICLRSICTNEAAILLVSEHIRRKFVRENKNTVKNISLTDMIQFITQNEEFEKLLVSEHLNTINIVNKKLSAQDNNEKS